MIFEAKTKVIDGVTFKVAPFAAIEALRLKLQLGRLLTPSVGRLVGVVDGIPMDIRSLLNIKIDGEKLGGLLEGLFSSLDEDTFLTLLQRMLVYTTAEVPNSNGGKTMVQFADDFSTKMDLVFQGKLFSIYPLLYFVMEVNYPDFFGMAGGIGKKLQTLFSKPDAANAVS